MEESEDLKTVSLLIKKVHNYWKMTYQDILKYFLKNNFYCSTAQLSNWKLRKNNCRLEEKIKRAIELLEQLLREKTKDNYDIHHMVSGKRAQDWNYIRKQVAKKIRKVKECK